MKYHYKDKVKILEGFHEGKHGCIVGYRENPDGTEYEVRIIYENYDIRSIWYKTSQIKKIDPIRKSLLTLIFGE